MRHSDEFDIRHVSNLWNKLGRRLNALHERDGPRAPARWCAEWRDEMTELLGQSLRRARREGARTGAKMVLKSCTTSPLFR